MNNKTAELVFMPSLGLGHLQPTVAFAKRILERDDRISISIFIINLRLTHFKQSNIYLDSQSRDNPYPSRLTFITLPPLRALPRPLEATTTSTTLADGQLSLPAMVKLYKPVVKQVLDDRARAGFPKPVGLVLDFFCISIADVADEIGVPSYLFYTSSASYLNLSFYAESLADDHGVDVADKFADPGLSTVLPWFKNPVTNNVIPSSTSFQDKWLKEYQIDREFRQVKGILVNSYMELESFVMQSLLNGPDKRIPPIYPVGPILELDYDKRRGGLENESRSMMEWLDGQPESSVVFLCFGSMGSFDAEQVKEIANGLERSGHRFLWALRKPPPSGIRIPPNEVFVEGLPEGFLDRTVNRGKVVAWAPQVEVLAHPAIGGFVSHCGWNSTLESLWFGVPIGAWPMFADQQLNAFQLVKKWELATEIRMDYKMDTKTREGNMLVTSEEIENGVRKLMNMDSKIRGNVKNISEKARRGLEEGGSSYNWLGRFIEDVLNN